jgi:hypothetical protein
MSLEPTMIATAFAALVLFVAVQCFLVVYVADKLTPGAAEDHSTQRPVDAVSVTAQYA